MAIERMRVEMAYIAKLRTKMNWMKDIHENLPIASVQLILYLVFHSHLDIHCPFSNEWMCSIDLRTPNPTSPIAKLVINFDVEFSVFCIWNWNTNTYAIYSRNHAFEKSYTVFASQTCWCLFNVCVVCMYVRKKINKLVHY